MRNHPVKCLCLFQHHISNKTIRHNHICPIGNKEFIGLKITDKIKIKGIFHKLVGTPGYHIPFFLFQSNIQQSYLWIVNFMNQFGVNGTNGAILV